MDAAEKLFVVDESVKEVIAIMQDDDLPRLREFAHKKFPNLSDDLIRRNRLELRYAMEVEQKCYGCIEVIKCQANTFGHVPRLSLTCDGFIVVTMGACGASRTRVENRPQSTKRRSRFFDDED